MADIITEVVVIAVASIILLIGISYVYNKYYKNIKQQISKTIFKAIFALIFLAWLIWVIIAISEMTQLTSAFSTLTISGIIGLAVTLAFQSTFSNILSGFYLIQENILRIGDIITYGGVKGEVVKLTYRTVWIRTESGEITIVSNSNLSAGPFTNHTATQRLNKNLGFSIKIGKKLQNTADKIPLLNE